MFATFSNLKATMYLTTETDLHAETVPIWENPK